MTSINDSTDIWRLAELIAIRNEWEHEIATIIRRPALIGHIGEYIAARIFGIQLEESASHKASDGVFADGPLAGRSVNIKWYARQEGILDLAPGHPDYYLALTGPRIKDRPPVEYVRPWLIEAAYLFNSERLLEQLKHVKIGIATSVRQASWDEAQMYPTQHNSEYVLSETQRDLLRVFGKGDSR